MLDVFGEGIQIGGRESSGYSCGKGRKSCDSFEVDRFHRVWDEIVFPTMLMKGIGMGVGLRSVSLKAVMLSNREAGGSIAFFIQFCVKKLISWVGREVWDAWFRVEQSRVMEGVRAPWVSGSFGVCWGSCFLKGLWI